MITLHTLVLSLYYYKMKFKFLWFTKPTSCSVHFHANSNTYHALFAEDPDFPVWILTQVHYKTQQVLHKCSSVEFVDDVPFNSFSFEEEMKAIIAEDRPFTRYELDLDAGFEKVRGEGSKYKIDNAERAIEAGSDRLSWYATGEPGDHWEDLCRGPHVPSTGRIGAFKLMSVASAYWHGDANSDGLSNIGDVIFILGYLFNQATPPSCDDAADVNDDGLLNIGDAIYLLASLFTNGAPPPLPGLICGPDTTADDLRCQNPEPCSDSVQIQSLLATPTTGLPADLFLSEGWEVTWSESGPVDHVQLLIEDRIISRLPAGLGTYFLSTDEASSGQVCIRIIGQDSVATDCVDLP